MRSSTTGSACTRAWATEPRPRRGPTWRRSSCQRPRDVLISPLHSPGAGPGSTVVSDGWSGYARLKDVKHDPKVVGDAPAHLVLPWVHRVFANAKRSALGVYHGLRPKHLQGYLDEFVFRFNRRHNPAAAFERMLGLSLTLEPATYQMLVRRS